MFMSHTGNDKITILIVYVDDVIVTCDDVAEIKDIKRLLAKEFQVQALGCRASSTPVELENKDRMFEGEPVEISSYQQLVGKLICFSHTRSDIAFAVSLMSQYMHKPWQGHLDAVHRILKYLKQAPIEGLLFQKTENNKSLH
ncbi:hypothetical protein LIER_40931 [Lithospermum erythrorhizon]|uniref:Reverse transcriptase Ty1/copia-type domain-containing protein n=1 Tax=Lithospermum erythrorhizon TaxID=34254 RepID=A0AAV3R5R3_LITER